MTATGTHDLTETRQPGSFGVAGSRSTRLLAGPPRSAGAESLASHEQRLGALALERVDPGQLRETIRRSGLQGRGGGEFPVGDKIDLAARSIGAPIVVVNASEGEPASRKDRTLLELRPHLVLDGAEVAATATGACEIVVYLHRERTRSCSAVEVALGERRRRSASATFRVIDAPAGYISGETSAVVSYLEGAGALPSRRPVPVAAEGVAGRPTVVHNVETLAHLGLIARLGAPWFRGSGTTQSPGSTLLTLSGAVSVPGAVIEVLRPVLVGEILSTIGGLDEVPRAVLLGGYAGTWIDGETAWRTPIDRHALRQAGAPLGCGLLAVLGKDRCGLAETARLAAWLATQSSGQCGPCVVGLPQLAQRARQIANGEASRTDVRRFLALAASVRGRGACGHPTGVVDLLESAIATFGDELTSHRRAGGCGTPAGPGSFPLPLEEARR